MKSVNLLATTEKYMAGKVRLPVVREEFFWPTEASVELEEKYPGEPNVLGACMRANYYRYVGGFKGDPYTPYSYWTFATGNAYENHLRELWKQMGLWIDNSVKFRSKEKHISGEMDVVLIDPVTEKTICVELKSYQGYDAAKNLKGNPRYGLVGKPKDPHLMQIMIYLDLHQHIFEYGKLIYIDKVCKDNVEFTISLHKEGENTYPIINDTISRRFSVEQIYERFEKLRGFIENKIIPPRDFELQYSPEKIEREFEAGNIGKTKYALWQKKGVKPGDFNCHYCKYKTTCWEIDGPTQPDETEDE